MMCQVHGNYARTELKEALESVWVVPTLTLWTVCVCVCVCVCVYVCLSAHGLQIQLSTRRLRPWTQVSWLANPVTDQAFAALD